MIKKRSNATYEFWVILVHTISLKTSAVYYTVRIYVLHEIGNQIKRAISPETHLDHIKRTLNVLDTVLCHGRKKIAPMWIVTLKLFQLII
tara:strand:- start:202 stop:471 length:270 start_codon:yes stop_codon:yes gene_type:complete